MSIIDQDIAHVNSTYNDDRQTPHYQNVYPRQAIIITPGKHIANYGLQLCCVIRKHQKRKRVKDA
eukprot:13770899-Heterocapsa_arctica.AAC.1